MSTPTPEHNPFSRLNKIVTTLEKFPLFCSTGFQSIVDHMGGFSASFSASASRAAAIRERHTVKGKSLGVIPLQQEHTRIHREVDIALKHLETLLEQASNFLATTDDLILWGLTLEQDAFLPLMADQIRKHGSDALERQTQCAIIDSLMRQTRPLIQEMIASLREASAQMNHLSRKLTADMDLSNHRRKLLKKRIKEGLDRMADSIAEIDQACQKIEGHAETNNGFLFEMMQTMQYDDISSQRLEHIATAIRMAQKKVTTPPQEDPKATCWFAIASRITMNQLEETTTDLVGAVIDMHTHLTGISDLAEAQKKTIFAARNESTLFQQDVAEITYHLNALLKLPVLDDSLLSEILRTLSNTENTLFMAHKSMETLEKTSKRLATLTDEIETKGMGRLETLSEAILVLTQRIREEGSIKREELLQAAENIQTINSEFSEMGAPKIMNAGVMLRRIPLTIKRLEMSNADLSNVFSESLADTQATYNQIMLLTSDITFHITLQNRTATIVRELQAILQEVAGPLLPSIDQDCTNMAEAFKELHSIYTMDSERKIHAAILGVTEEESEEICLFEEEDDGFDLF